MATVSVLGIDLGKNVCSLVGLDSAGKAVLRRRVRREGLASLVDKVSPCIVAMEACCGAHHIARNLLARGYDVRLMSPEYVRPYVKAQKNADRDAEAIAEAATRPTMRFVAVKSQTRLDMQALHRVRDRLQTALGAWLQGLLKRAHYNTVVVALANKLARIAWAVLRSDGGFVAMANLT